MLKAFIIVLCVTSSFGLDKLFASLGNNSNYSQPGAFQGQAAGYYTGGGFMMRTQSKSFNPIQVSLPRMGAGCRGIDAYFGGFSFMKGDQLIKLLRNMGTQAATYAFQLALKTMAPQVENLFAQLRSIALQANSLMLEDCRMVQSMYAAALPKHSAMQEQACIDVRQSGDGEDWFAAKQHCSSHAQVQRGVTRQQKISPDLLLGEYNLVWRVLQKIPELSKDKVVAEFIMSITGTLISRKADDRGFIAAYLKGGTTQQLSCSDAKCLKATWKQVSIVAGSKQTMLEKVSLKITSVFNKYLNKQPLTKSEIGFLNDTVKLPVYRYIQVSAASGSFPLMHDALEYIALSVLLSQFEAVASKVLEALDVLRTVQMDDSQLQQFSQALQQTRTRLHQLIAAADQGAVWRLTQMIQGYEQAVISRGN